MNGLEDNQGIALKERPIAGLPVEVQIADSSAAMIATKDLPIAKQISNEQKLIEEKFLQKKESEIEKRYRGVRQYLRLFQISRVIATLSFYLYLDQFDVHKAQQIKHKKERLKRAERLTRLAVYGEKLFSVRFWLFQTFVSTIRRIVLC